MHSLGFDVDFQASGLPSRAMNLREVGRLIDLNALQVMKLFVERGWLEGRGQGWPTARAKAEGLVAPARGARATVRWNRRVVCRELEARGHELALPPVEYLRTVTDRLMVEFRKEKTLSPQTPLPSFTRASPAVGVLFRHLGPLKGEGAPGAFLAALEQEIRKKGVRPGHFDCLVEAADLMPVLRAHRLGQALPAGAPAVRAWRM